MTALGIDRALEILGAPRTALPNLFKAAESSTEQGLLALAREDYVTRIAGNGLVLVQQGVAATDLSVGWAPWQVVGVEQIGAVDTVKAVAGTLLDAIVPEEVRQAAWAQVKEFIVQVVGDVVFSSLRLLTVIPVVGQILDILITVVESVYKLVKLAQASQAAHDAEGEVAADFPDPIFDEAVTAAILKKCTSYDWTAIWLPVADPSDPFHSWERGWGCGKIQAGGPWPGGRKVAVQGGYAWAIMPNDVDWETETGRGFPPRGTRGLGALPGTPHFHRVIQWQGKNSVDTGSWLRQSQAAQMNAWSMVWAEGGGPAMFAFDCDAVEIGWTRYVEGFLTQLANGETCGDKVTDESKQTLRSQFLSSMSVPANTPDDRVVERMPSIIAVQALRLRQNAYMRRTSIAYVNDLQVPWALQDRVRMYQSALLQSSAVCRVDPQRVPNGNYRGRLEFARQGYGAACYAAANLSAGAAGPEAFDPDAPPIPEVPPEAIPRAPGAPRRVGGAKSPPRRVPALGAPTPAPGGGGLGYALMGAGVLAALGAVIYYATREKETGQ